MLKRRGLLLGLLAAPAIIRTPGLLMPIKPFLDRRYIVDVTVTLQPPTDWVRSMRQLDEMAEGGGIFTRNGLFIVEGGINTFRVTTIGAGGGGGIG